MLGNDATEPAVRIGERPRPHVECAEVIRYLLNRREEHFLAEEASVVEVSGGRFTVAAVSVQEWMRTRHPR